MTKLPETTFPVSGVTMRLRRLPFMTIERIKHTAEHELESTKPRPPMLKIQTGPENYETIPDANDATYLRELAVWKRTVAERIVDLTFETASKIGFVFELTDEDHALIAEMREMQTRLGFENIEPNDRLFYLKNIACGSPDDYRTLIWELFGKSAPTEAQVAFHRTLFPSSVQKPSDRDV